MSEQMSPLAQRLIEQTRAARTPSQEDKDRVRKALMGLAAAAASMPAVASGAGAAKAAGGAVGLSLGAKVAVTVALVASVGGGTYLWSQRAPTAGKAPEAVVAPAAPALAPIAAPGVEPSVAHPAIEPDIVPFVVPFVREPAPTGINPRDPMLAELALLHRAQQAWRRGHAAQALELAQQHARRYPRSTLKMERDALRLFALCALGRKTQARPLAVELLRRAPDSPLRTSVEESCGMR